MGLSRAGKLILKCPVPTAYLHQRDGIFFFIPYLTFELMGIVFYLCLGNHNIYSPSFKDIFFALFTGFVLVFLFTLLGKVSRVTFFAENGVSTVGRYGNAFLAYREIEECLVSPTKHWNKTFYILDFTLAESENPLVGIAISRVETVPVANEMLEQVLQILRDKGVAITQGREIDPSYKDF
jgi:fucose 4-O-acetylase-like acetyltransferase